MTRRRRRCSVVPSEALESRALLSAVGSLDPTFATGGLLVGTVEGAGIDVELLDDGRIIAGGLGVDGSAFLVRLEENGAIDTTFGTDGFSDPLDLGFLGDIEILDDGKILAVSSDGQEQRTSSLQRFNSNGSLDTTFADNGTLELPVNSELPAIEVDSSGRILVLGSRSSNIVGVPTSIRVLRFNADGTPDTTFGTSGVTELSNDGLFDGDLEIDAAGNILIAAGSLYRVDDSGQLDVTFSDDGVVGSGEIFLEVEVSDTGTIYAAGEVGTPGNDGLVASFDASGNSLATATIPESLVTTVNVLSDGSVMAATGSYGGAEGEGQVFRYDADLVQDTVYGTPSAGLETAILNIEIDSSDRVVAVGWGQQINWFVARFNGGNQAPEANDDADSIIEDDDSDTADGNVLTNDVDADDDPLIVSQVNGDAAGVGSSLATDYGSIVIGSDGSYEYTLDNSNPAVDGLTAGQTLVDTIIYTAADGLGGEDTAELSITIEGADAPMTPLDQVNDLIDDVENLAENGDISGGARRVLVRRLSRVVRALERGQTNRAIANLRVFQSQIVFLYVFNQIELADAQELFGIANQIISEL
ncbi:MAG: VCBS domain-containing protein [Planctomycetaceae bacterium]